MSAPSPHSARINSLSCRLLLRGAYKIPGDWGTHSHRHTRSLGLTRSPLQKDVLDILKLTDGQVDGQVEVVGGQLVERLEGVAETGVRHVAPGRVVVSDQLLALEYEVEPLHQLVGAANGAEIRKLGQSQGGGDLLEARADERLEMGVVAALVWTV